MYFLHGTQLEKWIGANEIDPKKFRADADFGRGFYTYRAGLMEYAAASQRARQDQGLPIVIEWKIRKTAFALLRYIQYDTGNNSAFYGTTVNSYQEFGTPPAPPAPNPEDYHVVKGSVTRRDNVTGMWVRNLNLPAQWVFKAPIGCRWLVPSMVYPAI